MAASGFLAASFLLFANMKLRGLNYDNVNDLTIWTIISGIIGARSFYVVQFWNEYKNDLWQIIRIDRGGLVFYGGFIAAILAIIFYCRKRKISFLGTLDVIAPSLALGHAFGRIGCFLNGCCFGKPCNLPWAVEFPPGSFPFNRYPFQKIHPVQLYESAFNFMLCVALCVFLRKNKTHGKTAAFYLVAYGIARFILEFFRGDNEKISAGLTISQIIGIFVCTAGIGLFIFAGKNSGVPKKF